MTALPQLMQRLGLPAAERLDELSDTGLFLLVERLEGDLATTAPAELEAHALTTLEQIEQCDGPQELRDLLRLTLVLQVAGALNAAGRTDRVVHWVLLPMMGGYDESPAVDLDIARPLNVSVAVLLARPIVLRWLGELCYLGWNAGYFTEEITELVRRLGPVAVELPTSAFSDLALPMCHVAQWTNTHMAHLAPQLTERLAQLYTGTTLNPAERASVGLQVALLADHLGQTKHSVARDVLAQVPGIPIELELQLQAAAIDPERDPEDSAADLIPVIRHWRAHMELGLPVLGIHFVTGRQFAVILPLLDALLASDRIKTAMALLGVWHGVDPEDCVETAMIGIRREVNVNEWFWPGGHHVTDPHDGSLGRDVNAALGLAMADPAAADGVELPERDQPDRAAADHLDTRLSLLQADAVPVDSVAPDVVLVNVIHPRLPLAHVLADATGVHLPTAFSFQRPLPDRVVKRAAVFVGDAYTAEREARFVQQLLASGDVSVDVYSGEAASPDAFADVHCRQDHDVIWVASHGADGGWASTNAGLQLHGNEWIRLDQIAAMKAPSIGARRLLVLNACDSATAAGLGGPSIIGPGPLLACREQAVVGHLWPVGMDTAPFFAARFAAALAESESFLEAYRAALTMGFGDLEAVLHRAGVVGDDIDRLRRAQSDHLLDLASTVFMV